MLLFYAEMFCDGSYMLQENLPLKIRTDYLFNPVWTNWLSQKSVFVISITKTETWWKWQNVTFLWKAPNVLALVCYTQHLTLGYTLHLAFNMCAQNAPNEKKSSQYLCIQKKYEPFRHDDQNISSWISKLCFFCGLVSPSWLTLLGLIEPWDRTRAQVW